MDDKKSSAHKKKSYGQKELVREMIRAMFSSFVRTTKNGSGEASRT